jgi:hypothetical protein
VTAPAGATRHGGSHHRNNTLIPIPQQPRPLYLTQNHTESAGFRVDRYGYEIDPSDPEPTKEEQALRAVESAKERERELKWVQMLGPEIDPQTGAPSRHFRAFRKTHQAVFERRVMKGIPDACRCRAWYELLDSKPVGPGEKPRPTVDYLVRQREPACDRVIQVDIPRTMPHVRMFAQDDVRESLYRLLRAYSTLDSENGYFQGMAFSAALLRSYMGEERAFWAFYQLMHGSKHQIHEFYINGFARLRELNRVWEVLLQKKYPKIAQNLKKKDLDPMLYTPSWFLTGFQTMQLPVPFKLRMFDRQIVFGSRAILSFALTIVSMAKEQLKTGGNETCIPLLQNPIRIPKFEDWRYVIKKFDRHFLTSKEYSALFKVAGVKEFP